MGSKARPVLFSKWVGNRNYNAIPEIKDYPEFANDWITWWNSVQPKWRQNPALGLPLAISTGKAKDNLVALRKGGPSGLVTLLVGLKWWACIRNDDVRWKLAVGDLRACFTALTGGASKRKAPEASDNGKKRQKVT